MKTVTQQKQPICYNPPLGANIEDIVPEAIALARKHMKEVQFDINDITVVVDYASVPDAIVRDYYRALNWLLDSKIIGPRCEYPLSEESLAQDAAIMANKRRLKI